VEVLGALPITGTRFVLSVQALIMNCKHEAHPCSDKRLVELNAACRELVEASPPPGLKVGTTCSSESALPEWWRDSLSSDLATITRVHDAYANNDAALQCFRDVISDLCTCSKSRGHVYVSGIGKSAAVALRISLSLRSIGVPSSFVHGNEFHHGDLGTLRRGDLVVLLSNSGSTIELLDVATRAKIRGCNTVALTCSNSTALAGVCDRALVAPCEPDIFAKIPSRSIVAQETVGNMIVQGVVSALKVDVQTFSSNHPGGAIGAINKANNT
jgi:arabinose-5-phosphate isomerase